MDTNSHDVAIIRNYIRLSKTIQKSEYQQVVTPFWAMLDYP